MAYRKFPADTLEITGCHSVATVMSREGPSRSQKVHKGGPESGSPSRCQRASYRHWAWESTQDYYCNWSTKSVKKKAQRARPQGA